MSETPRSLIQYPGRVYSMPHGMDSNFLVFGARLPMWMTSAQSRWSAMAQQCVTLQLS